MYVSLTNGLKTDTVTVALVLVA